MYFKTNANWKLDIHLKDDGEIVDITGLSFKMTILSNGQAFVMSTDNGMLEISDAPNGVLSINASIADHASVTITEDKVLLPYELMQVFGPDDEDCVGTGKFPLAKGLT